MYTDDEKRIGLPIKTFLLSLLLIIIFILLLMWLLPIPKKTNNVSIITAAVPPAPSVSI